MGDFAVNVENASFSYERGKKAEDILKNVTLQVPKGVIYALLGPSGCGKTTLLKAISQTLILKRGSIALFGETLTKSEDYRGPRIGYMPQEFALIPELTVEETLYFFGGIHNVPNNVIKKRLEKLVKLLDIPDKTQMTKYLSGGQKRRLSFAAALVHSPPLLVLDEPTVGVDPLLRRVIWEYLSDLTIRKNTTVIITTHYIEEAKEANIIGLMRAGSILVESNPADLLFCMEEKKLESCFMRICSMVDEKPPQNEDENNEFSIPKLKKILSDVQMKRRKPVKKEQVVASIEENRDRNPVAIEKGTLRKTSLLIKRNLVVLKRNPVLMMSQFLGPTLQIISFCVCVGHSLFDLPLAIVNEESPAMASRLFLEHIDNYTITQKPYDNLSMAIESVRRRDTMAVLHLYSNFTKCLVKKARLGLDVDNETISCSSIKGHFDNTNKQIFGTLQRSIYASYQSFQEEMLHFQGASPLLSKMSLEFVEPIYGSLDMTFTEFILPAVIQTTCYFMAVALTAITFLLEFNSGVLNRVFVAGVTLQQVLISHTITQLFIVTGQVVLILLFPIIIFKIPFHGSLVLATALSLLQGVCGMSFGLLISAVTTRINTALLIALGSLYPNVFFSGYFWPLEGMPRLVRKLAYLIPLTLPTETLRAMTSRGWGIEHRIVWLGFLSTALWIVAYLLLAFIVLKTKRTIYH